MMQLSDSIPMYDIPDFERFVKIKLRNFALFFTLDIYHVKRVLD